ncbi:AraC family transcriptional regulator [Flavobacterium sp. LHD-85]|uniref:helix-turn-helix domain-containing protein n=1 Tax=Flavobacterium sp. LHD-85 TaxID=3071410 RepID=UPI0027E21218|nr:AraC family transcriptional regulator [Flavobacterium sp. LHD-85]MDQ6530977.1 AraC family transcriptional regulator [Flavobacterium sp. LHD-85]
MKNKAVIPEQFTTISSLHNYLKIKGPKNPLVSIISLDELESDYLEIEKSLSYSYNFYVIGFKKNFEGKIRYGQQYYDFDAGVMTCIGPGQVITIDKNSPSKVEGYLLVVHADFFANYQLATRIKEYGFFSYATNEALHLSDDEESLVISMFKNIDMEISAMIDLYTQDLVVSHIELLLNYCNRFYNRQFITRKTISNGILTKLEFELNNYFESKSLADNGLPSVQYIAEKLNVSPNYLSDMLRVFTGRSTSQHIQDKAIDKVKTLLTTTNLTVAEIAFELGFEFPQSLNKFFKRKTNMTPIEYRQSMN